MYFSFIIYLFKYIYHLSLLLFLFLMCCVKVSVEAFEEPAKCVANVENRPKI